MTKPPALATWLLRTFGSGSSVDALLGDLSEEYRRGRSSTWFWRQAVIGIGVSFMSQCRAHKFILIRAVLVGVVILYVLRLAAAPVVGTFTNMLTQSLLLPGWLYMQWQLYGLVTAGTWFFVAILAGGMVARLARPHHVVAILGTLLVVAMYLFMNQRFFLLMKNALTHERFLPYLAMYLLQNVAGLVGFLIGGLQLWSPTAGRRAVQ